MSKVYQTEARVGDLHTSSVSWTDEVGRALEVEDVRVSVYYYDALVPSYLVENVIMPVSPALSHRYLYLTLIPEGLEGKTLRADFKAVLSADNTVLHAEELIRISAPLNNQTMRFGF